MKLLFLAIVLACQCFSFARADVPIDWDAASYMSSVQQQIKSKWHPRVGAKGKTLQAVAVFMVDHSGQPQDLFIKDSSGDKDYDEQALATIRQCVFSSLPAGAPDKVQIEFSFDFNAANIKKDHSYDLDDNPFRVIHMLMRVSATLIIAVMLLVQYIMLIVFLVWLLIERSKLGFQRRTSAAAPGEAPGEQGHQHESKN